MSISRSDGESDLRSARRGDEDASQDIAHERLDLNGVAIMLEILDINCVDEAETVFEDLEKRKSGEKDKTFGGVKGGRLHDTAR